ncbi:MAG: hypothetical protein ABI591_10810 [Kofleriaceae bacterium]
MLRASLILIVFASASGCKSTECGTGTIDRDGNCEPADETTSTAKCGPFTVLQGDSCVPMFPPTQCDPGSTTSDVDPSTGVTTCIGTGTSAGCSGAFACPAPASGKQTICGQLYNFADNTKFAAAGATGTQCTTATATGPCGLQVAAFGAVTYAHNPTTTTPQATGPIYIDDCGRYRVPDITPPGDPFIALGWDDAGQPFGPTGITVTTGVAMPTAANTTTKDFEAWIVDQATVGTWQSAGGPMLSAGIYASVFRTHGCDSAGTCTGDAFANQSGVTITKSGMTHSANDSYFQAETGRVNLDGAANATSINGTGLYTGASVDDGLVYSGTGGIADTANCAWEPHAAASIPGLVFIQVYRPINIPLKTCTQ